ncbi:hypothetical protein F4808DRAFT_214216 [Astrocystis sublimbata]|nr:hypothetical protein F4808DRAFT_214216 [Astrocystis sublimbata]
MCYPTVHLCRICLTPTRAERLCRGLCFLNQFPMASVTDDYCPQHAEDVGVAQQHQHQDFLDDSSAFPEFQNSLLNQPLFMNEGVNMLPQAANYAHIQNHYQQHFQQHYEHVFPDMPVPGPLDAYNAVGGGGGVYDDANVYAPPQQQQQQPTVDFEISMSSGWVEPHNARSGSGAGAGAGGRGAYVQNVADYQVRVNSDNPHTAPFAEPAVRVAEPATSDPAGQDQLGVGHHNHDDHQKIDESGGPNYIIQDVDPDFQRELERFVESWADGGGLGGLVDDDGYGYGGAAAQGCYEGAGAGAGPYQITGQY